MRLGGRTVHPFAALVAAASAVGLLVAAPRLLLVVLIASAIIVGLVLVGALASVSRAIEWNDGQRARAPRVTSFVRRSQRPEGAPSIDDLDRDELADSLVRVIDDRLRDDHGIDRATDPPAAARALGPELARFVGDPAARRSMVRRRSLASTLTLIEAL